MNASEDSGGGYLGRFQLGDWVGIAAVHTKNGSQVVTAPHTTGDTAPCCSVYIGGSKIESFRIPIFDSPAQTGLFACRFRLGSAYSAGQGMVSITYRTGSGGHIGKSVYTFTVLPGGNANGTVQALEELDRPNGLFAVGQYASGTVFNGRNPY